MRQFTDFAADLSHHGLEPGWGPMLMAVPDQTRPSGLSDSLHLAIDVMLTDGSRREAAEAAGAARTTATQWANHRSEFRRELERRRYQRAEQVNDRVGALTTRSL